MDISVGIMQGRLLPPFEGRFQAFPAVGWDHEFLLARQAGLKRIEWIYEVPHEADNPLGSDAGIAELRRLEAESGVEVRSVCADYYMTRLLVADGCRPDSEVVAHLRWLIGRAGLLGCRYMVLPFVDSSSLKTEQARDAAAAAISAALPAAEAAGVELHLETDLPPPVFAALLGRIGHGLVRMNYDIGNSASLGYDPAEELTTMARWLGSVHVKDRVLGGGTVPLGTGSADFSTCFRLIRGAGFDGTYILQAARDAAMPEVELAHRNIAFVERQLAALE